MSVTELFPATEIKSAFDEVLQSLPVEIKQMIDSMGIDLSKIFVAPDKNSTTYDYLVKIISSEELKNAINKIIQFAMQQQGVTGGIGFGLTDTLDKMKVAPLFQMAGISVTDIARSFKDYTKQITKDSFVINLPDENGESDNLSPSPTTLPAKLQVPSLLRVPILFILCLMTTKYLNRISPLPARIHLRKYITKKLKITI